AKRPYFSISLLNPDVLLDRLSAVNHLPGAWLADTFAGGGMAEWSKALDSKSSVRFSRTVGSNPTPSANRRAMTRPPELLAEKPNKPPHLAATMMRDARAVNVSPSAPTTTRN